MSLDVLGLEIIMQSNNEIEAAAARRVKPVREQGNLLLVTLLFANTLATELLPLVLEALVPGGYFSLVVSVVSIMLFGEIIPQAVCSRHPLLIGSRMIGFVKILRTLLYPLSFPIAYALDAMLGEELGTIYNREELKGLIDVHASNAVLTQDETTILKGALEFSQKRVEQICTKAKNVFRLDIDSKLDRETLLRILRSGHSRIPLYESTPNNILCLLLVKQLVLVNPDDELPIRSLISRKKRNHKVRVAPALECAGNTLISDLLNEFQKGRSHMAIVYDDISKPSKERKFIGIVSIEDIIEEILQEEIIDETDTFVDNTNKTKVLVRNAEGQLVRATAHATQAIRIPGRNKTVIVKEINVPSLREPLGEAENGEKLRPDWKKPKSNKKTEVTFDSPSQPLLGNSQENSDVEAGLSQNAIGSDLSMELSPLLRTTSPAKPNNRTPGQSIPEQMQYARMPGQSMTSLFGEDDNVIPEDVAARSHDSVTLSAVLDKAAERRPGAASATGDSSTESPVQLKLRPLPEDASDERDYKRPRQRPGESGRMLTGPALGSSSYGSFDMGGSEGEEKST